MVKCNIHIDLITQRLETVFKEVLQSYNKYTIHACLKNFSVTDCDKYKNYTKELSYKLYYLCENDPDNVLETLYIYNPSSIMSMLHKLFEMLCHVDIRKRIQMVK